MLYETIRRRTALVLCALIVAVAASTVVQAQFSIGYALREPNYRDAADVGRHVAYSIILGSFLPATNNRRLPRPCQVDLAESEFPDLLIPTLAEGGADGWRRCLERIDDILRREAVTQSVFDAAAKDALHLRPIAPDDRMFSEPNLSATRVRMQLNSLGELALKRLFPNDPLLMPLIDYYDWLSRESRNYDGFVAWLESQRHAERFGLYSSSGPPDVRAETNERLRKWGFKVSAESTFPAPPRPQVDFTKGVRVNVPALRGRSFLMIRCNHVRDPSCDIKLDFAFCGKGRNEIFTIQRPKPDLRGSNLRCGDVGKIRGLPGWLVADSTDIRAIKWFQEELTAGRLRAPDVDLALIEYIVPVTVD